MNEQIVAIGALGRVINLSDRRIQQLMKEGVLERHEEGSENKVGGGGGRHICLVRDSNPTDVTVRYQNIP